MFDNYKCNWGDNASSSSSSIVPSMSNTILSTVDTRILYACMHGNNKRPFNYYTIALNNKNPIIIIARLYKLSDD